MSSAKATITGLIPLFPIVIPLGVHFLLVNFVFLYTWLPLTYFFCHLFILFVGIWACHAHENILPVIMFIAVVAISILMDIIQLGLYFSDAEDVNGGGQTKSQRTWQFSAAMTIMNLLFKPITIMLGILALYFRTGGSLAGLRGGDSYARVDDNQQGGPQ